MRKSFFRKSKFSFIIKMKEMLQKKVSFAVVVLICFLCSSCDPYLWMGLATGLMSPYGMYNTSYPSYSGSSYAPSSSSSSSSSSSVSKCSRCNGTGNCKTCGGTGRKYDYGAMSITTHEKYEQRCGVCNGTGKCGVCDGKGFL